MSTLTADDLIDHGYAPADAELLATVLEMHRRLIFTFWRGMGRRPTYREITMLWALAQRENGIPEHKIEPSSMRRH